MKVIKEYQQFQKLREASDMEELIALRFELRAQEIELEAEIENLEPFGYWSTHTDLQEVYQRLLLTLRLPEEREVNRKNWIKKC